MGLRALADSRRAQLPRARAPVRHGYRSSRRLVQPGGARRAPAPGRYPGLEGCGRWLGGPAPSPGSGSCGPWTRACFPQRPCRRASESTPSVASASAPLARGDGGRGDLSEDSPPRRGLRRVGVVTRSAVTGHVVETPSGAPVCMLAFRCARVVRGARVTPFLCRLKRRLLMSARVFGSARLIGVLGRAQDLLKVPQQLPHTGVIEGVEQGLSLASEGHQAAEA